MIKRCRMDIESLRNEREISGQENSQMASNFQTNLAEFVRNTNVSLWQDSITLRDIDVRKYFFDGNSNFQVFLSHSSRDKETVYKFVSYLQKQGINAFVDSMVWDNYKDLLNEFGKGRSEQEKLNIATHLHMILASSLTYMIDACDCFIFLASENSISNGSYTFSPWIYHELLTVSIIQKRHFYHLKESITREDFKVKYDIPFTDNFELVKFSGIISWIKNK